MAGLNEALLAKAAGQQAAAHRPGPDRHHGDPGERGLPHGLGAAGQGGRQAGAHGTAGAGRGRRRRHRDDGPAAGGGPAGPGDRRQAAHPGKARPGRKPPR